MVGKAFQRLAAMSEKRPWMVILGILLITALALVGMTRLHAEYGYKSMLPRNTESVKTMEEAENIFGGTMYERVLLEGDGILRGDVLRRVARYGEFLQGKEDIWETLVTEVNTPLDNMVYISGRIPPASTQEPLIGKIDTLSDEELVQQVEQNLLMAEERAKSLGISIGQQSISSDRHALLVQVRLNPSASTKEMIGLATPFEQYTREYFQDLPGIQVYNYGEASLNKDSNQRTMKDTRFLFLLAMVFIIIVLFITFRRISDILLTLMVIIVTIIWVMGLGGWLGFPFTYSSSGIMPLLLGIDIAYAIHVLSRYYEERRKGNDTYRSAITSVVTVGVAVFLTAATTAFGFASFGISNMPPIQQFGALCVAGVMFSFLLAVTLLPATLILRDRRERAVDKWERRREKMEKKWEESLLDRALVKLALLSEHHRAVVGAITLLVIAGCILLGTQVNTEADMTKMMPKDMPSIVAMDKVNYYFGGQDYTYALVKGDILEPANLDSMLKFEDAIASSGHLNENGEPLFIREKIFSIADVVRNRNGGTLPSSKTGVLMVLASMQGSNGSSNRLIQKDYYGKDRDVAMINVQVGRGSQTDMKRIAETIRSASAQVTGENPSISMISSGFPILINDILGSLVPTQLKTSALALVLCALIVILVFRSLFFGLAAASVVFISIALEIGVLVILGWPLDFMTVMVSSLVIGAGIDYGIHVTHRFREEWHYGGVGIDEAMRRTVSNVGKALLAAALTTAGAFAIIASSKISYMRRFGGITAVSLTVALLSSLLVLPSILAWRAVRVERKRGGSGIQDGNDS